MRTRGDGSSSPEPEPRLTLLDLVAAVNEIADGELETVAIVASLLDTGRVRLAGEFRENHLRRVAPGRDLRRP